jgi:hypothetical protein
LPISANPQKRDFFVYQFKVDGYPFYVGIGRAERASDRLRYVRSLMLPEKAAKLTKTSLSVRVMAALLRRDIQIRLSCTRRPMNRRQALDRESREIKRLLTKGFMLTNWQQNPQRHNDARKVVRAILSKRLYRAGER